ncbi:MAG: hypothetical protein U9R38_02855 [Candidatus Margulisiibacteriota bacterium]|nr:hypothetical protein [Candidatus Margulisiibacteriota bacterium]
MSLGALDMKKAYYYVICVIAFFILMWGVVDLASASAGLYVIRGNSLGYNAPAEEGLPPAEKGEQFFDAYYQRKMLHDRFWDSLSRIFVSGVIFAYFRITVNKLEAQA